ncbi:MAG: hypothetical protein ACLUNQ_08170 [Oscillospiraceae bacterium]
MVSIVEVTTRQQLRRFVDFPNQLYKDVPQSRSRHLRRRPGRLGQKENPAFSYCEARCWLALREGEIVGRIGAILSRKSNSKWAPTVCASPKWTSSTTRRSPGLS